jgi:hypothetical protein
MKRKVTLDEMDQWGKSIAAKHAKDQDAIDEIALAFTGAVDQK